MQQQASLKSWNAMRRIKGITKHKQYPLLSDYDKKNEFDIEKYVKNRNKLRFKRNDVVDEVCDVGEIAE